MGNFLIANFYSLLLTAILFLSKVLSTHIVVRRTNSPTEIHLRIPSLRWSQHNHCYLAKRTCGITPRLKKKKKRVIFTYFSDSVFKSHFPELITPLTSSKLTSLNLTFRSKVSGGVKILSSIIPEDLKQANLENYDT